MEDDIETHRAAIRRVDSELLALLGERRQWVKRLATRKASLGLTMYDPAQEARVVRRLTDERPELGPMIAAVWSVLFADGRGEPPA